jgi:hypothetical protein
MKWFGRAYGAPYESDCEHVPVPVGEPCMFCGEALQDGDTGMLVRYIDTDVSMTPSWRPYHYACHMRQIVGGLNHQLARCTCCGGTEPPDPDDMTRREAAEAAVKHWQRHRRV